MGETAIPESSPEIQSVDLEEPFTTQEVLGRSTGGHPIEAYHFGSGPISVALIGGIHGGYEWNTVLLAYEMIDYFSEHPDEIPASITLTIIPEANPDGIVLVTGHTGRFDPGELAENTFPGRFNANEVDINRNWNCNWEPVAFIFEIEINAGSAPFSEAETRVLRNFILKNDVTTVVFWHSQMSAVFPGDCDAPHEPSRAVARLYADAAGYDYLDSFDQYPVSGDAANWLASQDIAAIEVELAERNEVEFEQNLDGVRAVLAALSEDASGAAR
ncbi:MAG: hypothetical protein JXJ17_11580 [Anaerolineae bacterium]|nr:hypothetical protein [Anaerolineae bacterium]